jgi:VanZ family protein
MFWKSTLPAWLWALLILILCGLPGNDLPDLSFIDWLSPDKIAHLVLFGVQCFLLLGGFNRQGQFPQLKKYAVFYSLSISIAYGALVEVLQNYVFIQRSGDVRDALANALGAAIGYWYFRRKAGKQSMQKKFD